MEATAGFFTYPSYGSYQAPMPSYVPDKSRQYNESPFGGQQVPLNPLPQQPQAFLLSTLDQVDASSPWLYSGLPPNNYGYNQSPSMSMLSTTAMPSQYLLPTTAAEPTTSFPGMNNYSHQLQPSIGTFCQDYSSGAYVNFGGIPSAAMQESEEMPMSSEKVHMMPNFNRKSLKQSFLHQLSQLSQHQCQWLGCYAEFPSAEKLR